MAAPIPSHLGSLLEGLRLLRRHPAQAAGLALLAMGLAQLGPALELAAGAGPGLLPQTLFSFAGLLPLEMYFLPRLMARLDAEVRNVAGNPAEAWAATFDARWLRAFLVRMGVSFAVGVGLVLFIIPGVVLLTLFGWAPLRILLRGESLAEALRGSQAAMARHWPKVIQAVLGMTLVALAYQLAAGWLLERALPPGLPDLGPGAWLRLRHPGFWVFHLLGGAINLWFSCALLALFHRLESAPRPEA